MIGMIKPLLGVTDGDIIEFVNHWLKLHDLPSNTEPYDFEIEETGFEAFFESIDQEAVIREEIWNSLESKLTPEVLAGLSALLYFESELRFSEQYVDIYEVQLRIAAAAFEKSREDVRLKFFHIFDNTSVLCSYLRSLYFLKKYELAEHLITLHGLDSKFSWLDEARSRVLF